MALLSAWQPALSPAMRPIEHFHFCPKCGHSWDAPSRQNAFACDRCGFVYYFNPALAAVAIVLNSAHEALFIRRGKEPEKGKLGFPGGFIDAGETAEQAVTREIREELGLGIQDVHYLCSQPNVYTYRSVTYSVLDTFFVAVPAEGHIFPADEEVQSFHWLSPKEVDPTEFAFSSHRVALAKLLADRDQRKATRLS